MKNLIFILAMGLTLTACKQEDTVTPKQAQPVLLKVQAVHKDGQVIESQIMSVK